MKVREFLVYVGVKANTKPVEAFEAAVGKLELTLNRMATRAVNAAAETLRVGAAAQAAGGQMHGPITQSQALAMRLEDIGARAGAAHDHLANAGAAASDFAGRVKMAAGGVLVLVGAITAYTGAAVANALAVGQDSKQIEEQAKALGYTVEQYQELRTVLGDVGIDASNMADLLNTISEHAQAAANGSKEMAATYKLIGVNANDLKNKHPQEVLERIADGLAHATNEQKRLAFASGQFGDDLSRHVVPVLQQGGAELRKMMEQAKRTGGVLSDKGVKSSAAFARSAGLLTRRLTGLRREAGAALAPALLILTDRMSAFLDTNSALIRSSIVSTMERIGIALVVMGDAAETADKFIRKVGGYSTVFTTMAAGALALTAAFVLWQTGGAAYAGAVAMGEAILGIAAALGVAELFAGIPALIIGAAAVSTLVTFILPSLALFSAVIAGIIVVLDELWITFSGGDSLIRRWAESWKEQDNVLGAIARLLLQVIADFVALGRVLSAVGSILYRLGEGALDFAQGKLKELWKQLTTVQDTPFTVWLKGVIDEFTAWDKASQSLIDNLADLLEKIAAAPDLLGAIGGAFGFSGAPSPATAPLPAPVPAAARGSQKLYQGGTYNINGGAMSAAETAATAQALRDSEHRAAAVVLSGGDE